MGTKTITPTTSAGPKPGSTTSSSAGKRPTLTQRLILKKLNDPDVTMIYRKYAGPDGHYVCLSYKNPLADTETVLTRTFFTMKDAGWLNELSCSGATAYPETRTYTISTKGLKALR